MKLIKRLILFLILTAFIIPESHAQFILGSLRNNDAAKLSQKLTSGLTSDTAKVLAIHDWIIHHIKYDLKKWKKSDLSAVPVKKILRKRKAICTGYSDLFNELCTAAKIRSVAVPGYIKEIHVDITDNFYLDEHIWNAVFVGDEWKLVDACWDAGYIAYSKSTFFGHILKLITGGKHDILKYKPHFVKFPTLVYYCRQGKFFKNDHLAQYPCWQMLNPVINLNKFREDSAYYLMNYDTRIDLSPENKDDEILRNTYYSMDDDEKIIADGVAGTKFNFRNQYRLGLAHAEVAYNNFSLLDPASKDTLLQLRYCDTILQRINKAMVKYDSNVHYLKQQKLELSASNTNKNKILNGHNNKLIAETRSILRSFITRKPGCVAIKKSNSKAVRSMRKKFDLAFKSESFYKKKRAKTTMYADSLKYVNQVLNYEDTLERQGGKLQLHYILLDSLYERTMKRTVWYSSNAEKICAMENCMIPVRFAYYDDYDHEVRSIKDTILKYKFPNDSLLFIDGKFFLKEFNNKLNRVKNEFNRHMRFFRIRAALLTKFKGACRNNIFIEEEYARNLAAMSNAYDGFEKQMGKWNNRLNRVKVFCQKQKSPTRKELRAYRKEMNTEAKFYKIRKAYIDRQYRSLTNVNKVKRTEVDELKKNTLKIRKIFTKGAM